MAETTEQLAAHIESRREGLRSNLEELEQRVESLADWRAHFRRNPLLAMGITFAGGLLLAGLTSGAPRQRLPASAAREDGGTPGPAPARESPLRQALDQFQSVLLGVVAARAAESLIDLLPRARPRGNGKGSSRLG